MLLSKIINEVKTRPRAFILFGPPSSGKTFWAENFINRNKFVDYDNLNIAKFDNIEDRTEMLEECINKKNSFIFEGLALKEDRIENLINKLNENSYKTFLVYLNKNMEIILENDNGRTPEKTLKKMFDKNKQFFDKFKDKFEEIIEVQENVCA